MQIPNLSEETLRENTSGGSLQRGEQYFEEGAVQSIEHSKEGQIIARVKGSSLVPYEVHIRFTEQGIADVSCTCPYVTGTWCKHVVAVLLAVLKRDTIARGPTQRLNDLVDGLDRDQLMTVLRSLAERQPALLDLLEEERDRLLPKG